MPTVNVVKLLYSFVLLVIAREKKSEEWQQNRRQMNRIIPRLWIYFERIYRLKVGIKMIMPIANLDACDQQ